MNDQQTGEQPSDLKIRESDHPNFSGSEDRRGLELLRSGSLEFGIFEEAVATIADWREPTPLPHSPPAVLGVVSIQGRMLTLLDLQTLLGGKVSDAASSARRFILALRGDEQLALAIEDKGGLLELSAQDIRPPSETAGPMVLGEVHLDGRQIGVLDVKELFHVAIRGRERRRRRL